MIYVSWLMLDGSWAQTLINIDVAAPATGFSMGLFYGVGVVFGVSALAILATTSTSSRPARPTEPIWSWSANSRSSRNWRR